ncbi:hypothetical protein, partial [Klebsiella pneumoniae]|uniref:hypothetical protein n=1 Tax=Klebsiella pneumoniae TaxID=573 RepID=UPI00197AD68A
KIKDLLPFPHYLRGSEEECLKSPECSHLAPAKKVITGVKTDILNYEEFMPQNQDTFSTQKSNPLQSGKVN